MFGRTDSRGRLLALLAVLVLLSGGMTARLAYWQMERQPQLTALAAQGAKYSQRAIPAKRGTIYDRTGTIVLAETVKPLPGRGQPARPQRTRSARAMPTPWSTT